MRQTLRVRAASSATSFPRRMIRTASLFPPFPALCFSLTGLFQPIREFTQLFGIDHFMLDHPRNQRLSGAAPEAIDNVLNRSNGEAFRLDRRIHEGAALFDVT